MKLLKTWLLALSLSVTATVGLAADYEIFAEFMTVHDLFKVEYLLTTLSNVPAETSEQIYHLTWLRNRQRFLNTVLARRRMLQRAKIVDLAAWRRAAVEKETLADVA